MTTVRPSIVSYCVGATALGLVTAWLWAQPFPQSPRKPLLMRERASVKCADNVLDVAFDDGAKTLAIATYRVTSEPVDAESRISAELWCAKNGIDRDLTLACKFPGRRIDKLTVSRDGKYLAFVINDSRLAYWPVDSTRGGSWTATGLKIVDCAFASKSNGLVYGEAVEVSGAQGSRVSLFRPGGSEIVVHDLKPYLNQIARSADDELLAVEVGRGVVEVWQIDPWTRLLEVERPHPNDRNNLDNAEIAFSPNRKLICIAGDFGFTVARVDTGKEVAKVSKPDLFVSRVRFDETSSTLTVCEHAVKTRERELPKYSQGSSFSQWKLTASGIECTNRIDRAFRSAKIANNGKMICYVPSEAPQTVVIEEIINVNERQE